MSEKYDLDIKCKMFNCITFKLSHYNTIYIPTLNLVSQIAKQLTEKELEFFIDLLKIESINTKHD